VLDDLRLTVWYILSQLVRYLINLGTTPESVIYIETLTDIDGNIDNLLANAAGNL